MLNIKYITISKFSSSDDGKFINATYDGIRVSVHVNDGFISACCTGQRTRDEAENSYWEFVCSVLSFPDKFILNNCSPTYINGCYVNPQFIKFITSQVSDDFSRKVQYILNSINYGKKMEKIIC
jgi:hypothetical protein